MLIFQGVPIPPKVAGGLGSKKKEKQLTTCQVHRLERCLPSVKSQTTVKFTPQDIPNNSDHENAHIMYTYYIYIQTPENKLQDSEMHGLKFIRIFLETTIRICGVSTLVFEGSFFSLKI